MEEFHYSVKYGPLKNGKPTIIKGSFQDWKIATELNIRVTHHTIGVGAWIFQPSLFFYQPPAILYPEYIPWNIKYPIQPPDWYKPNPWN